MKTKIWVFNRKICCNCL